MNSKTYEHYDTTRLNAIPITGVAQRLGFRLKREGAVYKTLCPWHEDHDPSLTFYERTNENQCYCFACRERHSVIDLVMQAENWTFQEACQWLSQTYGIGTTTLGNGTPLPKPQPRPEPKPEPEEPTYVYIPTSMVDELVTAEDSLSRCLKQMFQPAAVEWIVDEYRIGCYAMYGDDDFTVFPNIDAQGRVCNLKVQHYITDRFSPRFAHGEKGKCYMLGSIWIGNGVLAIPEGVKKEKVRFRSDCLFGEHLLPRYPDQTVALVESPKNALFGALAFPQMLWVATGNKGLLKREVLQPLRERDVIVIPDKDAVNEWKEAIATMTDIANFTVSDFCQRMAPPEEPKFDIADYLQAQHQPMTF